MAITNAQQFKQLVNPPMEGKKRPGYRGEAAAASDAAAGRSAGRDTSPAGTGNVGGDFDRGSFRDAVRRGELKAEVERLEKEKLEEKLENFRKLNSRTRQFQNYLTKVSPVAMFASKFGPLNTRDFFTENYLSSKNAPMTKEQFANLTEEEKEKTFDDYMSGRMSGKTDAYGNPLSQGDGDGMSDYERRLLELEQALKAQAVTPVPTPFAPNLRLLADGGKADDGRIGFRGGDAARSDAASGRDAGRADPGGGVERGGGDRDRRRVEQYTKPPTVGGGGGSQKTPVVVNPLKNLSTHFANNQKLKDAVALGLITNDEYNVLGGYDAKQTLGMGPIDTGLSSLGYNVVQSIKGDQPFSDIFGDVSRNVKGATNISPELQTKYENIMQMADGGRIGAMEGGMMSPEGGIMDLESGRQMYFLGKLVKKATRAVKKIVKSPIGKAALAFGAYKLGGMGFGKSGASLFERIGGLNTLLKAKATDLGFYKAGEGLTGKGMLALGGGLTLAPFLFGNEEEEQQPMYQGADIQDPRFIMANYPQFTNPRLAAEGGLMRAAYQEGSKEPVAKKTMPLLDMDGKEMDLREEGGFVPIGRMEKADDVPARLSKNEFVFTADAVRNAGDGNVDKGAEVMYNMMKNLESGGDVSEESQGLEGAREMFQTSQRLEEVL